MLAFKSFEPSRDDHRKQSTFTAHHSIKRSKHQPNRSRNSYRKSWWGERRCSTKSLMIFLSRSHPSEKLKHMKRLKISKTESNSQANSVAIIVRVWFSNHQSLFTQRHDDNRCSHCSHELHATSHASTQLNETADKEQIYFSYLAFTLTFSLFLSILPGSPLD